MDKINFIFKDTHELTSPWVFFEGLRRAFDRIGALNVSFNIYGHDAFPEAEMEKYPILVVRGHTDEFVPYIQRMYGRTKLIDINTETLHTVKGDRPHMLDNVRRWGPFFNGSFYLGEEDEDFYREMYGANAWHISGLIDTRIFRPFTEPSEEDILFCGESKDREFPEGDLSFVKTERTPKVTNSEKNAKLHAALINKYRFYLSPTPRWARLISGKPFEGMACKRLVFIKRNPWLRKTMETIRHLNQCVYYADNKDLTEKFAYYSTHGGETLAISQRGLNFVTEKADVDVMARRIMADISTAVK